MTIRLYEAVQDKDIAAELMAEATKPIDVGSDALPFDHLSGRRFEILAYLLKQAGAQEGETVTLVKASGDRGRDVLLYKTGRLAEMIQCKNQCAPMTRPEVIRELLKVSLHAHVDSTLLPSDTEPPVTITMWCSGGFTEPAALLVDTWNAGWVEEDVVQLFREVIERNVALRSIEWAEVRRAIMEVFPRAVRLKKVDSLDLTLMVRSRLAIYRQFFTGLVLAPLDDVREAVRAEVTQAMTDANWRRVSDEDIRHVLDRVEAFPADQRFYLGTGYVLGIPAQLIVDMTRQQKIEFFTNMSVPIFKTSNLFMEMANEKAFELVDDNANRLQHDNKSFPMIAAQVIARRALAQLTRLFTPSFLMEQMADPEMPSGDVWEMLDLASRRLWPGFSSILSPDFRPPTQDHSLEARRKNIAHAALKGYPSRESFEAELVNDCRRNLTTIRELVASIEAYFPRDLLVIADSRSSFDDPALLKRDVDQSLAFDRLAKQRQGGR